MQAVKEEFKDWYNELSEGQQLKLWQMFSVYLNNNELKLCMSEVKKGKHDLFEIHNKHGLIDKYQIYFNQIMRKLYETEDENGRED